MLHYDGVPVLIPKLAESILMMPMNTLMPIQLQFPALQLVYRRPELANSLRDILCNKFNVWYVIGLTIGSVRVQLGLGLDVVVCDSTNNSLNANPPIVACI